MDIKPPQRKKMSQPVKLASPTPATPVELPTVTVEDLPPGSLSLQEKSDSKKRRRRRNIIAAALVVLLLIVVGCFTWYAWATAAKSADSTKQSFSVGKGETLPVIAEHLEKQQLIRSAFAFEIYAKVQGVGDQLQAGSYKLSPNQSVSDIIALFKKGQNSVYNVFIPPGLTLKQLADPSVKGSFAAQGFSATEIQQAFSASYTSALLKDKPSGASLEGYIYPETFQVRAGDSLQSILERSFDELYTKLEQDGLITKFAAHGLNLYQALTLASIVQKETSSAASQPQVAQVFLLRLETGMALGSDVTFIYAAHQLGVTPTPELDSPYNTRIHTGLPPGPVANMNYSALQAVAAPAPGDYLFFVAGDDGVIHFSRTNAEHEQQVQQYCQKLCSETLQ